MITGLVIAAVSALIGQFAIIFFGVVALSDPLLETRWKFRAVVSGAVVTCISVFFMTVGLGWSLIGLWVYAL